MEVCENTMARSLLSSGPEAEPRVSLALDKTLLWLPASRDHVMAADLSNLQRSHSRPLLLLKNTLSVQNIVSLLG